MDAIVKENECLFVQRNGLDAEFLMLAINMDVILVIVRSADSLPKNR